MYCVLCINFGEFIVVTFLLLTIRYTMSGNDIDTDLMAAISGKSSVPHPTSWWTYAAYLVVGLVVLVYVAQVGSSSSSSAQSPIIQKCGINSLGKTTALGDCLCKPGWDVDPVTKKCTVAECSGNGYLHEGVCMCNSGITGDHCTESCPTLDESIPKYVYKAGDRSALVQCPPGYIAVGMCGSNQDPNCLLKKASQGGSAPGYYQTIIKCEVLPGTGLNTRQLYPSGGGIFSGVTMCNESGIVPSSTNVGDRKVMIGACQSGSGADCDLTNEWNQSVAMCATIDNLAFPNEPAINPTTKALDWTIAETGSKTQDWTTDSDFSSSAQCPPGYAMYGFCNPGSNADECNNLVPAGFELPDNAWINIGCTKIMKNCFGGDDSN